MDASSVFHMTPRQVIFVGALRKGETKIESWTLNDSILATFSGMKTRREACEGPRNSIYTIFSIHASHEPSDRAAPHRNMLSVFSLANLSVRHLLTIGPRPHH